VTAGSAVPIVARPSCSCVFAVALVKSGQFCGVCSCLPDCCGNGTIRADRRTLLPFSKRHLMPNQHAPIWRDATDMKMLDGTWGWKMGNGGAKV